jgi:hypothetical protein
LENSKELKLIRFNEDLFIVNIVLITVIMIFLILAIISAINGRIGVFTIMIFFWSSIVIIYQYYRWKYHNPKISHCIYNSDISTLKKMIFVDII